MFCLLVVAAVQDLAKLVILQRVAAVRVLLLRQLILLLCR
jgi:hypothetical protein